jgi:outer membrane protein assembly factor BamB
MYNILLRLKGLLKRLATVSILILLLISMLPSALTVKPFKAWNGTVYIQAGQSINLAASVLTYDKIVYTINGNIASDRSSDIRIWNYTTNENVVSLDYLIDITNDNIPEVVAGSEGYPFSTPAKVYLLSGADGKELWHFDKWENFWEEVLREVKSIPDVTGDNKPDILVGVLGEVYVLNGLNGKKVWATKDQFPFENRISGWPSVDYTQDITKDGKPEVVLGATFEVRMVNGVNGKTLWKFKNWDMDDTLVASIPDVTGDGIPDVVTGSNNCFVYMLNGSNGKIIWQTRIDSSVVSLKYHPDAYGDSIPDVIVGSAMGTVYLLSGLNGNILWTFKTNASITPRDGIVTIHDITGDGKAEVVIGSYDHNVYLLNGINGEVIWTFKTENKIESVACVPDAMRVIVGSRDKKVYLIDGRLGNIIWEYETEGYILSCSCIPDVSNDGRFDVIAGSSDHNVYCLNGWGSHPTQPEGYILHVQSYPISGIQISYSGDYSGTGMTNFDIGPENSPFAVTLTAPSAYQGYTFDHWELDGQYAGLRNSITVNVYNGYNVRTAVAYYRMSQALEVLLNFSVVFEGEFYNVSLGVPFSNFNAAVGEFLSINYTWFAFIDPELLRGTYYLYRHILNPNQYPVLEVTVELDGQRIVDQNIKIKVLDGMLQYCYELFMFASPSKLEEYEWYEKQWLKSHEDLTWTVTVSDRATQILDWLTVFGPVTDAVGRALGYTEPSKHVEALVKLFLAIIQGKNYLIETYGKKNADAIIRVLIDLGVVSSHDYNGAEVYEKFQENPDLAVAALEKIYKDVFASTIGPTERSLIKSFITELKNAAISGFAVGTAVGLHAYFAHGLTWQTCVKIGLSKAFSAFLSKIVAPLTIATVVHRGYNLPMAQSLHDAWEDMKLISQIYSDMKKFGEYMIKPVNNRFNLINARILASLQG